MQLEILFVTIIVLIYFY